MPRYWGNTHNPFSSMPFSGADLESTKLAKATPINCDPSKAPRSNLISLFLLAVFIQFVQNLFSSSSFKVCSAFPASSSGQQDIFNSIASGISCSPHLCRQRSGWQYPRQQNPIRRNPSRSAAVCLVTRRYFQSRSPDGTKLSATHKNTAASSFFWLHTAVSSGSNRFPVPIVLLGYSPTCSRIFTISSVLSTLPYETTFPFTTRAGVVITP